MPRAHVRDQEEESVEDNVRDDDFLAGENKFKAAFNVAKPYLVAVNSIAGLYILWMVLHFVSANLYVYYCAHMSVFGFLMSPVLASAPHCRAIRWVLNSGAQSIDAMWIVLGTWVCSKLALIGGSSIAAPATQVE
ncbi:MAG: hypothetical protein EBY20_01040 [Alphaproteobacteria bacterium]|nr:hypothetical protein [Alphaproteobacteria bacterium]